MKNNSTLHIILFVIIVTLFYICERSWMFEEDLIDSTSKLSSALPFLLFLVCLFYKAPIWKQSDDSIIKKFSLFYYCIIFLTYIQSINYPLNARLEYITIPLPLILFWASNKIAKHVKEEFIIYAFVLVTILLGVYYFKIYFDNSFNGIRTMSAYTILYLLPFLLCLEKPIIKYVGIIFCLAILMASLKRGGLICFVLSILSYLYINYIYFAKKKYRIIGIIVIGIVVYSLEVYLNRGQVRVQISHILRV